MWLMIFIFLMTTVHVVSLTRFGRLKDKQSYTFAVGKFTPPNVIHCISITVILFAIQQRY